MTRSWLRTLLLRFVACYAALLAVTLAVPVLPWLEAGAVRLAGPALRMASAPGEVRALTLVAADDAVMIDNSEMALAAVVDHLAALVGEDPGPDGA